MKDGDVKACEVCGGTILRKRNTSRAAFAKVRFCSLACFGEARRGRPRKGDVTMKGNGLKTVGERVPELNGRVVVDGRRGRSFRRCVRCGGEFEVKGTSMVCAGCQDALRPRVEVMVNHGGGAENYGTGRERREMVACEHCGCETTVAKARRRFYTVQVRSLGRRERWCSLCLRNYGYKYGAVVLGHWSTEGTEGTDGTKYGNRQGAKSAKGRQG